MEAKRTWTRCRVDWPVGPSIKQRIYEESRIRIQVGRGCFYFLFFYFEC